MYRVTRPGEAVITDKLNLKFELAAAGADDIVITWIWPDGDKTISLMTTRHSPTPRHPHIWFIRNAEFYTGRRQGDGTPPHQQTCKRCLNVRNVEYRGPWPTCPPQAPMYAYSLKIAQCEYNIWVLFPVVHFVLIRRQHYISSSSCRSAAWNLLWLVMRNIWFGRKEHWISP